jgi:hypothetical protein
MGEWLLSRRDSAIVAWHEVPEVAALKEPSRRVRSDSCRSAPTGVLECKNGHVTKL